jgi:uncharacterized cupredoxin-like copper-binding protein
MTFRWVTAMWVSGLCSLVPVTGVAGDGHTLVHEEAGHADSEQHVTIYLNEYRFEPAHTLLVVGKPAQLSLVNNGKVVHEFVTKALLDQAVDIRSQGMFAETTGIEEVEIPPGAQVDLFFTPEKSGEFAIACHASKPEDHLARGMSGTLVIK